MKGSLLWICGGRMWIVEGVTCRCKAVNVKGIDVEVLMYWILEGVDVEGVNVVYLEGEDVEGGNVVGLEGWMWRVLMWWFWRGGCGGC